MRELVELFDLFDSNGVALVFLDMNLDTSTSQGRLLRHIMAAFAEYESDVKSDYAKANHRLARSKGHPVGLPPYGYTPDRPNRSYMVEEEQAKAVRFAFDSYARGGVSQYRIAKELTAMGVRRPSGTDWHPKQIGRILDNPAYGALCLVDDRLVPANWEAIVDRATWDRVREVRNADQRRAKLLRRGKFGPYLLTGFLYCGHCGHRLVHRAKVNGASEGIYLCVEPGGRWCPGGSIGSEAAEEYVTDRFLDRCHFTIQGEPADGYTDGAEKWGRASVAQRRSLLSLAIRKVVVAPWPGGDRPRRAPGRPRQLTIEWTKGGLDDQHVLVAEAQLTKAPPNKVSGGRHEMLRELEVSKEQAKKEARSARSKAYFSEWRRFQRERQDDRRAPSRRT